MSGVEAEIIKEIEDEVQSILERSRREEVHYFRVRGLEDVEQILEVVGKAKIVLISFDGLSLKDLKRLIYKLRKEINGEIYMIRWPLLLILSEEIRLKIHG